MTKTERKIIQILTDEMTLLECCEVYLGLISCSVKIEDTKLAMLGKFKMPGTEQSWDRSILQVLEERINKAPLETLQRDMKTAMSDFGKHEVAEPLDNTSTV